MLAHDETITITTADLARLRPVLDMYDTVTAEQLDLELHRARVVAPEDVPADVVTMNSEVVYEDCATGVHRVVHLVYPSDAVAGTDRVSVLAPIGSALLGLRVGQAITWKMPRGEKRIRVIEVRYQPEAANDR